MSHLTDLAREVTAALDAFAQGDLDAGYTAASKAHALALEASRVEAQLGDNLYRSQRDRVYGPERPA